MTKPSDQKEPEGEQGTLPNAHRRVFIPAAAIVLAFVLFVALVPETAQSAIGAINDSVIGGFGWYYVLIVTGFVVFALWVGLGHFGDIKLGRDDEKPEFRLGSWLAMLFAAGMGIGLMFWGVAEPLYYYAFPKPGVGGSESVVAEQSLVQVFLHWGIHPWAIYVVVGLAIAYAVHRKGRPVSVRWALYPLLGDRVKGRLGDAIDIAAIVGTLFGVATSLGLGVSQVAAGFDFLGTDGWSDSNPMKVLLIGVITLVATVSVVTGIKRGIRWLSNTNMVVAAFLMVFVLIAGPTLFMAREFVESIGVYLQNLLSLSFETGAMQGEAGADFANTWTIFYWGWWISWAPFVGVFIARISRGRTIRQFVGGVLLVPTIITIAWFTVMGAGALHREVFGSGGIIGEDAEGNPVLDTTGALFQYLDAFPGGTIIAGLAVLLVVLFFVTSSDSGSYVVDMLATGGNPNPPVWSRVFWAVTEGAVAAALLLAGGATGLGALQTMAIIIAFPFSIVMIAMCFATAKELRAEREAILRVQRRRRTDELTEHVSQSLIDSGLVDDPGPNGDTDQEKAGASK